MVARACVDARGVEAAILDYERGWVTDARTAAAPSYSTAITVHPIIDVIQLKAHALRFGHADITEPLDAPCNAHVALALSRSSSWIDDGFCWADGCGADGSCFAGRNRGGTDEQQATTAVLATKEGLAMAERARMQVRMQM